MASTDKLRKASGSTRPVVTTLSLPKAAGSTTAELTSATGWNTATGVDVVIYRRQLNTTTGLYEKIDGTQTDWTAQLTGTTLSGMIPQAGTEPAAGYAADGNTVVLAGPTAQWSDDLIETLLTLFNQDQTLKPGPIQTALGLGASTLNGWNALGYAPNTVVANGNRNYTLTFNSVDLTSTLSAGMRLRTTRTVTAPTQSTSLNGTTQYYSKSSPAGMGQTDSITESIWIKPTSYATSGMISRNNGTTDGWKFYLNSSGQVVLAGARVADDLVTSYQSVPLNKWTHISASINTTTTTGVITIDGISVPVSYTNNANTGFLTPTATYLIGATNGTSPTDFFPGKIAQAASYSAVISVANIQARMSQTLAGTETSLISVYSFNASTSDLNTTNANNLTSNGSAVATNADSPFGGQAGGTISATLDYAIVQSVSFSTNTTVVVQVPEGCTIPTSGGVTSVVYSSNKAPYGMPTQRGKWSVSLLVLSSIPTSGTVASTVYNPGGINLNVPAGSWRIRYELLHIVTPATTLTDLYTAISTSATTYSNQNLGTRNLVNIAGTSNAQIVTAAKSDFVDLSVATPYYILLYSGGTFSSMQLRGNMGPPPETSSVTAENAYL